MSILLSFSSLLITFFLPECQIVNNIISFQLLIITVLINFATYIGFYGMVRNLLCFIT